MDEIKNLERLPRLILFDRQFLTAGHTAQNFRQGVQTYVVVVYHCSNRTWVVEEIFAFGNRLRSTNCRELNYLKLCRPAYFVRTTQSISFCFHTVIIEVFISYICMKGHCL